MTILARENFASIPQRLQRRVLAAKHSDSWCACCSHWGPCLAYAVQLSLIMKFRFVRLRLPCDFHPPSPCTCAGRLCGRQRALHRRTGSPVQDGAATAKIKPHVHAARIGLDGGVATTPMRSSIKTAWTTLRINSARMLLRTL
jgi:hypothetical protein